MKVLVVRQPWAWLIVNGLWLLCVAAGGYLTARLARRWPMKQAAAMGVAGITVAAMRSPEASHASRLQWITTAVLSIPAALAGGVLCQNANTDRGLEKTSAG